MTTLARRIALIGLGALLLSACGQPDSTGQSSVAAAASVAASPSAVASSSAAPAASAAPTATLIPSPTADSAPAPTLAVVATVEPTASTAPTPTVGAVSGSGAGGALATHFRKTLTGDIGGQYPIEMSLTRFDDVLSGTYFYVQGDSSAEPVSLVLSGTVDADGNVQLTETDADTQTGAFSGKLEQTTDGGVPVLRIAGTWQKPDSSTPLPFTVTERVLHIGESAAYISDVYSHTEDVERKVTYDAAYPAIVGGTDNGFNAASEKLALDALAEFRAAIEQYLQEVPQQADQFGSFIDVGYEVTSASPTLVSILFNQVTYSAGAAHPAHVSLPLNYDLAAGRTLELADLFAPGADYLGVLSKYAIAEINTRDLSPFIEGADPKPENYRVWNIQADGLRITFDEYQVAAYAAGPQTVVVPWSELQSIISADGPAAAFAQ